MGENHKKVSFVILRFIKKTSGQKVLPDDYKISQKRQIFFARFARFEKYYLEFRLFTCVAHSSGPLESFLASEKLSKHKPFVQRDLVKF